MTPRAASRLAWILFALTVLCALGGSVLLVANGPTKPGQFIRDGLVPDAVAVTYAGAGAFIAVRRPGNRLAWILVLFGLSFGLTELAAEYAVHALVTAPGSLPGGWAAAWLQYPFFEPVFPLWLPLIVVLFPDGRLPSRTWLPLVWLTVIAGLGVTAASAFSHGPLVSAFRQVPLGSNPLGVLRLTTAQTIGLAIVQVAVLGLAGAATLTRLVRSTGVERQQLKWLAFTGSATAICAGASVVVGGVAGQVVLDAMIVMVAVGFPTAIAMALLRHRLFDIDTVIHRSLVYATLALFISGVYVAVVAGLGALVGTRGQPNLVLSILATAVVAIAFQPVRERLQYLANQLVYGRRATPYEAMAELSHRIAGELPVEEVLPSLAEVTARAIGSPSSRVRLYQPGGQDLLACWPPGAEVTGPIDTVGVMSREEPVGEISVQRPFGEPLTRSQRTVLSDLAVQAGPIFSNVRLTSELRRRVDEISARARQLRESRERIVTAADAQRRRLDEEIQAGTQHQLEAVAARLGEAKELLQTDPARGGEMLNKLADQAQVALDELRDLARGVFPPLLADRGLVPAMEAHLRKVRLAPGLEVDAAVARARFDPDVEAALYFCCVETLQHAGRTGSETPSTIRLVAAAGWLELTVPAPSPTGLRDVTDRIEALGGAVEPRPGATLLARIPMAPAARYA